MQSEMENFSINQLFMLCSLTRDEEYVERLEFKVTLSDEKLKEVYEYALSTCNTLLQAYVRGRMVGKSVKQIADEVGVSYNTLNNYRYKFKYIFAKYLQQAQDGLPLGCDEYGCIDLSNKAKNVLRNAGLLDRDSVINAWRRNGDILPGMYSCGDVTRQEIIQKIIGTSCEPSVLTEFPTDCFGIVLVRTTTGEFWSVDNNWTSYINSAYIIKSCLTFKGKWDLAHSNCSDKISWQKINLQLGDLFNV